MVDQRVRLSFLLLVVALHHVSCNYLEECPELAGPGCTFDGENYADGEFLDNQCLRLRCDSDEWHSTGGIDPDCGQCSVFLDPHVTTSNGYTYSHLQSPCNYSLIQPGLTFEPEFAIFSNFEKCNDVGSCIGSSFFKDNPETVVEIGRDGIDSTSIFTVHLGDDAYAIPPVGATLVPGTSVLVWRSGDSCIQLAGSNGLSMEACVHYQFMWSYPSSSPYYGLCGLFDDGVDNDLTMRSNFTLPLNFYSVPSFVFSWLTEDQQNSECPGFTPNKKQVPSLCQQTTAKKDEYREMCNETLGSATVSGESLPDDVLSSLIEACMFDLCLISQSSNDDQTQISEWLNGPVLEYGKRVIELLLASKECEFNGETYLKGETREEDCYFYECNAGQWDKTERKVPSCCTSEGEDYENNVETNIGCNVMLCSCGEWEDTGKINPSCCEYEGTLYADNEEFTSDCIVQKCTAGNLGFVSNDPNCCEYEGELYADNEEFTSDCIVQKCTAGNLGFVSNDPNCCEYQGELYADNEEFTSDCIVQKCTAGNLGFVSNDPNCCQHGGKLYGENAELSYDCIKHKCIAGEWEAVEDDPVCCIHHGKPYPNDAIVAIDCYMSSCSKGKWVPTGLPDPKCCEIGGRKFSEDTEAVVDCYIFKCKDGNWIDTNLMDPDCQGTGATEHNEGSDQCLNSEGLGSNIIIQVDQRVNAN
ncbi:uncharacterized protein LOC122259590 [Penaeus japonicus]|uniref:uncharacterized protein LOC122259590 n=1 Tax=Penaeus japonicus TaxID=27405 RepID=UPI001C714D47|nr:uncharacterized protein LOC122259590 [Penaeus japonicus]